MKKPRLYFLMSFVTLLLCRVTTAQRIDSSRFFTDEDVIKMELTTDIKALQSQKGTPVFQAASVKMQFPDSSILSSDISVAPRGVNRRETCRIPPMMLNFRQNPGSPLASLGKLKLVLGCGSNSTDEELLLKEFIVYKIYNMLEDLSFRVRLLRVSYVDTKNRIRPFTQYAFLIEDDTDLARRNHCKKKVHGSYLTESTDRNVMTMVALFQYMVGNTDWAVPNNHNIKLVFRSDNDAALPYAIPYDFDYCGLVDASYAVPNEIIGTEKVTERVYRGFPRTMEELQVALDVFRAKKEAILNYVRNFQLLPEKTRRTMVSYLNEFYETISSKGQVESIFIDNARKS